MKTVTDRGRKHTWFKMRVVENTGYQRDEDGREYYAYKLKMTFQ